MFKAILQTILTFLKMVGIISAQAAVEALTDAVVDGDPRTRRPGYRRLSPGYRRYGGYGPRPYSGPTRDVFEKSTDQSIRDEQSRVNRIRRQQLEDRRYHDVVLIAFDITGPNQATVYETLESIIPQNVRDGQEIGNSGCTIDSWWIADDDYDGADCDSAVFVKKGRQIPARAVLRNSGHTSE